MPDKQTSSGNNQAAENGSRELASSDELISFAESYFSTDFQNSERLDCPPHTALRASLLSGQLPDENLRKHLFGCSECFHEYQTALRAQQASVILQPGLSWWQRLLQSLTLRRVPLLAGAFSLLFVCLIGAYLWRQSRKEVTARNIFTEPTAVVAPPAATPRQASNPPLPETAPPPPSSANQPPVGTVNRARGTAKQKPALTPPARPRPQPAIPTPAMRPTSEEPLELEKLASVKIDLDEFTASRGMEENNASQQTIKLPRSRQRLLLFLPEGSSKGLYEISILAPSGKALVAAKARSRDGKTVAAILNTQQLAPGRYSLRITEPNESTDLYPLVIGDEKSVH